MKRIKLDWDSSFFEKNICRLDISDSDSISDIKKAINQDITVNLLYIFTEKEYPDINILGVNKVDEKVTFEADVSSLPIIKSSNICEYVKDNSNINDLYELAFESGKYSRFLLDTNFEEKQFKELYKTWIDKSISNEIADIVLCYYESNVLLGMITLKKHNTTGIIGLVGVSNKLQGRGIGKQLMSAVYHFAIKHNIERIEVPTQSHNLVACSYYIHCGFKEKNRIKIYHYWK